MPTKKKALPVKLISEAKKIFRSHGWSIENENTFERFCNTLEILSIEQRKLYLKLTKNFLLYESLHNYRHGIISIFNKLDVQKYSQIYVYPLLRKEDFNKEKSSKFTLYLFKSAKFNLPHDIEKKLRFRDMPSEMLPQDINIRDDLGVILVDDFIGTGKTALDAIKYFYEEKGLHKNKIIILSLVAQQQGIDIIHGEGVQLYIGISRNKGISDNFDLNTRTKYLDIMESIEKKIDVKDGYRFGFGQSEALVKMVRTPNNTFPIYWKINDDPPFMGIFPR